MSIYIRTNESFKQLKLCSWYQPETQHSLHHILVGYILAKKELTPNICRSLSPRFIVISKILCKLGIENMEFIANFHWLI